MDFKEIVPECFDCSGVAQDRDKFGALVNKVMNLCVPYNGM